MIGPAEYTALLERQRELESESLAAGAKRFRDRVQQATQSGKTSSAGAAKKLMQHGVVRLETAVKEFIEEQRRPGRRGLKHQLLKYLSVDPKVVRDGLAISPDVAAYMTLRAVFDAMGRRIPARLVAVSIADLLVDEMRFKRFERQATGFYQYTIGRFQTSSYAHMARSLTIAAKNAVCHQCYAQSKTDCEHMNVNDLEMLPATKVHVGMKLIDLALTYTGLIELERTKRRVRGKLRDEMLLVPAPDTTEWMNARNGALEFLWPVNLPMVVPPLAWAPQQKGGYRYALRSKYSLVRGMPKVAQKELDEADMPVVYDALNRIQETPWKVNPAVLELLEQVIDRGGGLAKVPAVRDDDEPRKPPVIEDFDEYLKQWRHQPKLQRAELSDELLAYRAEWKAWRKKAGETKNKNHVRRLAAKEFFNTYGTALRVKDDQAIFFPCSLDFRGRVYPLPNYLHPQGSDLAKSLLIFAEGKPLGDEGSRWLALHGANMMDEADGVKLKKATLEERIAWVAAKTEDILAVVDRPLEHRWWMDADKPLQFYAFCCEWAAYVRAQREGREFVSSLPCAMDGTCNGLQHFAAMLRDEVGGAAVNVVPMDRPQDIYQRVADLVIARLETEAATNDLARRWLASGVVNRKFAKRPTMTFGYGSKKYGFAEQLVGYVKELDRTEEGASAGCVRKHFFDVIDGKQRSVLGAACGYASVLIWDALWETVIAASKAMDWMQRAARGVSSTGRCVEWTVQATGFPVKQRYMNFKVRQIDTMLAGKLIKPAIYERTDKLNGVKQANAVAPNFVHSLDAAALMLTVVAASNDGVSSFGMVHDSYATHAADAAVLAAATRQVFVKLYHDHDVIAELAEQLRAQYKHPDMFPVLPERGQLDLSGVLVSDYFFL